MSSFSLCINGHQYDSSLEKCPYCPSNEISNDTVNINQIDKTIPLQSSNDKTQIISPNIQLDNNKDLSAPLDSTKTQIFVPTSQQVSNNPQVPQVQGNRKLVGWLVSFTINPLGIDFKLFEGRNVVGSDPNSDITVPNDGLVSRKHITILYRMGKFKFKDELSSNGTFINDVYEEEGDLKDGDNIKIGNTLFKLRTV